MSQDSSGNSLPSQQQTAGDIDITGNENNMAFLTVDGNASVDQSRIIYNYYYYHQEPPSVQVEAASTDHVPCPYRGLFHFGPDDAEFFFGREVFVSDLVKAVQIRTFIPVLGASGSGKSSVVFAGLVPQLQQAGNWQFTHFRPGNDPFHALALALVPLYRPEQDATDQMVQARKLATYLQNGEVLLTDAIARIQQNYPNQRVLVIADQFEELYTLCREEATRRAFLDCILASLTSPPTAKTAPLVLVATMRADFLGNALSYRPFADVLQEGDVKLGAMNQEELCDAIEKPAAKLGVMFEAGLAKRILQDVESEPGNLPLLEFALTELWERRDGRQLTHAAYEAIGEVEGALARYADEEYARLSASEREQVRRIFIQLVRPGEGTVDTRRLATKAELGEERWALVTHLATSRLVVTSQDAAKQETVEVVHEALIRNWGELRRWMTADRTFRVWQDRLRGAMHQWEEMHHDEGTVLRGAALVEAEEWLKKRQEDLSPAEQQFIQASLTLQRQERAQRERRRRVTLIGLAGFSTFVLWLAAIAGWQWRSADQGQIEALAVAANATFNSNRNTFDALIDAVRAGERLQHSIWFNNNTELQRRVLRSLAVANFWVRESNRLAGHKSYVNAVEFSRDGQLIATAGFDNVAKLWTKDGKELQVLVGHSAEVTDVSISPNNQFVATASFDKTVKVWNLQGTATATLSGHTDRVWSVAIDADSQLLASSSADGTIRLWRLTGQPIRTIKGAQGVVYAVVFSRNGTVISAGEDGSVKVWSQTGRLLQTLQNQTEKVISIALNPAETLLATTGKAGRATLWNRQTGKPIATLKGFDSNVRDIAFSPDGQIIATGHDDNAIRLWNLRGELLESLEGHRNEINSLSFSPDGHTLASASSDKTVKLWNLKPWVNVLGSYDGSVYRVSFSRNGTAIAASSRDMIKTWKGDGELVGSWSDSSIYTTNLSSDGKLVASSSDDTVKLWTLQGRLLKVLGKHNGPVLSTAFNPENDTIVSAGVDGILKFWTPSGKPINSLQAHPEAIYRVVFSPDGTRFATASLDHTIRIWSRDRKLLQTLKAHTGPVYDISFSPDGQWLATVSEDNTLKIWSHDGSLLHSIKAHDAGASGVSISPSGQIATVSDDRLIKLWTAQGEPVISLIGHTKSVNKVSFSPDGKLLVTGSDDQRVLQWNMENLTVKDLVIRGCERLQNYLNNQPDLSKDLCRDN